MSSHELLNKAIKIATKAHKKQTDKYDAPYLGHVLPAFITRNFPSNTSEKKAFPITSWKLWNVLQNAKKNIWITMPLLQELKKVRLQLL